MVRPIVQIRPNVCRSCDVGYAGLEPTLQEAIRLGYDITDLGGNLATKEDLERVIADKIPLFLNGFGHGSETLFTGQNTLPVVSKGVNEGILAGMITYLLSCLTGVELGPAIIAAGGWSFIGYTVSWTWIDEDGAGDPFQDKYAAGFYDGSNMMPVAILNGLTTKEAQQAGYDKYTEWINYWAASNDPYASDCIQWLLYDRDNSILLGDPGATLDVLTHLLTVNSSPQGIPFNISGIGGVTPDTKGIVEGIHTVSFPEYVLLENTVYRFNQWEDGSPERVREINLVADSTINVYYSTYAYLVDLISEPIRKVPILIDEVEYITPSKSIEVEAGIRVFKVPPSIMVDGATYTFLKWEDGTTDPTRTIFLTSSMTITAYFIGIGATPVTFKLTPGPHLISVPEVIVR